MTSAISVGRGDTLPGNAEEVPGAGRDLDRGPGLRAAAAPTRGPDPATGTRRDGPGSRARRVGVLPSAGVGATPALPEDRGRRKLLDKNPRVRVLYFLNC